MNKLLFISLFAGFRILALGQNAIPLNNDYPFTDGVYLSFEEFKGDNPTYRAGQFRIDEIDSMDYDLTKVSKIKILNDKGHWKRISISEIWGLTYDGIPYIYYRGLGSANSPWSKVSMLTRIDVVGTISMFRLEHQNMTMNTNTFTNKMIHSDRVYVQDMLLDMNSGKVHIFDHHSVEHYIRNDEELLHDMKEHRLEINLYDIVFAYNIRHPSYPSPVSFYEN